MTDECIRTPTKTSPTATLPSLLRKRITLSLCIEMPPMWTSRIFFPYIEAFLHLTLKQPGGSTSEELGAASTRGAKSCASGRAYAEAVATMGRCNSVPEVATSAPWPLSISVPAVATSAPWPLSISVPEVEESARAAVPRVFLILMWIAMRRVISLSLTKACLEP